MQLSATFEAPGLVHVQGGNGIGKSTLVELCSGYLRPWQGIVRVGGMDAHDPRARAARRICRSQPALYPDMTVRDHLVFTTRCNGADLDTELIRAVDLGLYPWLDQAARTLSTGNARKLWYVMCTTGRFNCAVLDEPFNGLDHDTTHKIATEISGWSDNRLVLLVSHTLPPGLAVSDTFTLEAAGAAWR
ncbi:ATP-binding cassette domain-containing protein (plasmid) [Streptomyces murinus]|uniref:ABC transporter ATP-binding protein n=1 Tax=Streptomyces murinus TaxID=33900 RepID=UPI002378DE25|nr:ATP-binding cassette domain-containing protein [Streptomyces murinus]WDO11377.1 ATP-binding cassette domain-containing protein [Streptomyces murinus]